MACHVPGARTPREFWAQLRAGETAAEWLDDAALEAAGVPAVLRQDPNYVPTSLPLPGLREFDASFFGLSPKDAAIMDPQHRHFLMCAWEALEDAGHDPARFGGPIGVFGGCGMNNYYFQNLLRDPALFQEVGPFLLRHTGNDKDFLTTFVSYKLNLTGPSIGVQTACSTSLVAIHLAAQSLLSGECDLALAGGATIELPHGQGYLFRENEILAKDGMCRPFDADATGTLFGSGAGIVVLRRLEDALADGDEVRAVLLGSAVNNDGGQKAGWLAPSVQGQTDAAVEALAVAGVDPSTVAFLEAHGTGTAVGDPIEVQALAQAYRGENGAPAPILLGSVKANIGHLDTAAGVMSFIKTVEALRHRTLPPNPHFTQPNPQIDFAATPFAVQHDAESFPEDATPLRASVNSLGVGGTNAHAVLEAAPDQASESPDRAAQVWPISAKSPVALAEACARLADALEREPDDFATPAALADAAFTLQEGRAQFAHRTAVVAKDRAATVQSLRAAAQRAERRNDAAREAPGVSFLFPGGGAQYPTMAAGLRESEPVFREQLELGLQRLREKNDLDLSSVFAAQPEDADEVRALLDRPSYQLPAIFLVEVALARLWESWGVRPDALLGHSLGENAAACVAGVFQFEEALDLVVLRGRLFEQLPPGGMLSVAARAEELEELLPDSLVVGARNAPEQTMISGPVDALGGFAEQLDARGLDFQRVKIDCAAHSPALDPILAEFRGQLERMTLRAPEIPMLSNLTGTWLTAEEAQDPEYWVCHLRHTVRFSDGAAALLEKDGRVLLEVGPGKILGSLARQQPAAGQGRVVLASLRHPDEQADDQVFLLETLGELWAAGVAIDWERVRGTARRMRKSLPTYPFERREYWVEPKTELGAEAALAASPSQVRRLDDFEQWFSVPNWIEGRGRTREVGTDPERWLVFLDRHGVGEQLVQRLRADGQDVVEVREGDAYYRFADDAYALAPEGGRSGYESLFRDLAKADRLPERIVHLWSLTDRSDPRPGSSLFHHHQERGFYSLFFLAQTIGEHAAEASIELDVVANELQTVHTDDEARAEKATLLGPVLVMPREYPGVSCRALDFPLSTSLDLLYEELRHVESTPQVAWREGRRFELKRSSLRLQPSQGGELAWTEDTVVLITGGLGELALTAAEEIARKTRAQIVLVGRRGLPAPQKWDAWLATHAPEDPVARRIRAVRRIEEQGSEVLLLAADVANPEEMHNVRNELKARYGRVDVVLHAAGVLEDGVMQLRSPEAMERVFAPKVHGAQVLLQALEDLDWQTLVLFSSTSVTLGPAGQADYVAANAYLNSLALQESGSGKRVLALNWGVWNQIGMAEALAADLRKHSRLPGERLLIDDHLFDTEIRGRDEVAYRMILRTQDSWWLDEHRLTSGRAVLPGTAYLELMRRAWERSGEAAEGASFCLESLNFLAACPVPDDVERELQVRLLPAGDQRRRCEIRSRVMPDGLWDLHVQGRIRTAQSDDLTERIPVLGAEVQSLAGDLAIQPDHLRLGARWRAITALRWAGQATEADLALPSEAAQDLRCTPLHPVLMDAATGCAVHLAQQHDPSPGFWVPLEYGTLVTEAPLPVAVCARVVLRELRSGSEASAAFDLDLLDADGRRCVQVRGLRMRRLTGIEALFRHDDESATVIPAEHSPAEEVFLSMLSAGITPQDGMRALHRVLTQQTPPIVHVSSIDLQQLQDLQDAAAADLSSEHELRFERPALASAFVEASNPIEQQLVAWWQELLGVDQIGVQDDFFELGGHSLIAVRLFSRIKREYRIEHPLSVLFQAPTIAEYARLLQDELGSMEQTEAASPDARPSSARARFRYLVPMNEVRESTAPPFFLVAGMFGNVLNLRHLAMHLGEDRPVYAIQAAGLRADEEPHRRFEEMARAYLAEIRQVQPHGPYLLGGFSGGGIAAFEMAQQLRAEGEETAALVLLDTPIPRQPEASLHDRITIFRQRLREEGAGYAWKWLGKRLSYEWSRLRGSKKDERPGNPAEFRSEQVKDAFLEAVEHYQLQPVEGLLTLFRPKLDCRFELKGGRFTNEFREVQDVCNHWLPYALGGMDTYEVDGDHDSMVLEPHVRVLGARMRVSLREAMGEWHKRQANR